MEIEAGDVFERVVKIILVLICNYRLETMFSVVMLLMLWDFLAVKVF